MLNSWLIDIVQEHFCASDRDLDPTFQINNMFVAREIKQKLHMFSEVFSLTLYIRFLKIVSQIILYFDVSPKKFFSSDDCEIENNIILLFSICWEKQYFRGSFREGLAFFYYNCFYSKPTINGLYVLYGPIWSCMVMFGPIGSHLVLQGP